MTITADLSDGGLLGAANALSSNADLQPYLASSVYPGDMIVLVTAVDNYDTADGVTNRMLTVTDNSGANAWRKINEYTNGQGVAQAGITVATWICVVKAYSAQLHLTLQWDLLLKRYRGAYAAQRFRVGNAVAGVPAQYTGSIELPCVVNRADDNLVWQSCATPTLTSRPYLFIRTDAMEAGTANGTATATAPAWTGFTTNGSAAGSGCSIWAEYLLYTGTSATSLPTAGNACDRATSMFALFEGSYVHPFMLAPRF